MIADRQDEAYRPEAVLHATLAEISGCAKRTVSRWPAMMMTPKPRLL